MHNNSNQDEKVKRLAKLLAGSKATARLMKFSEEEWMNLLEGTSGKMLDEGLMILDEEQDMYEEVGKERIRKKKVNKTRLLQRTEKLKVQAEELANKHSRND